VSWWHDRRHPVWNLAQQALALLAVMVATAYMGAEHLDLKDIGGTGGAGAAGWVLGRFFNGGK